MAIKTSKISELIKALENIKNIEGDLPIVMSKDEEGNGYSAIDVNELYGLDNGVISIYPSSSHHDIEDFI